MNVTLYALLVERDALLRILSIGRRRHVEMPETRAALTRIEHLVHILNPCALVAVSTKPLVDDLRDWATAPTDAERFSATTKEE